jgi:hypothetical protein
VRTGVSRALRHCVVGDVVLPHVWPDIKTRLQEQELAENLDAVLVLTDLGRAVRDLLLQHARRCEAPVMREERSRCGFLLEFGSECSNREQHVETKGMRSE